MILKFHYLTEEQIARWRAWVVFLASECPDEDIKYIPEVSVYPTLLHSFADNFKTELVYNDKVQEDWYQSNVWAYAVIMEGNKMKSGRKIALCVGRLDEDVRSMPIEFNFLHEIGHFNIMRNRLPRKFYHKDDEMEANRYALIRLMKILKKYPHFKTYSLTDRSVEMESVFRKYIAKYKSKSAEEVADIIMEALKWKTKT